MKKISYEVKCFKNDKELKPNTTLNYTKLIAEIIYKRKEKVCYEKSSKKRIDFKEV